MTSAAPRQGCWAWPGAAGAAGRPAAVPTCSPASSAGPSGAKEAGDAALALLRAGVEAVTAADQAAQGVERGGGVDEGRLTGFTDPDEWAALPPLRTIGAPPKVFPVTPDDLTAAFPGTRSWANQAIFGVGGDRARSWCAPGTSVDAKIPDRPGDRIGGGEPAGEQASIREGRSGPLGRPRVDVDVLRWGDRDAVGATGVDQVALDAADAWGVAIAGDATACPGAVALDPAGLPGERATLTVVDDDGRWRVQAIVVGGPTAVRVQATIEADDAATAGDRAVAMARRVVANTVRADAVEQGRTDPGPLP